MTWLTTCRATSFASIASNASCVRWPVRHELRTRLLRLLSFVLARDPLIGQETAHPPVWGLPMPLARGRQIVLYYTFDDSTVWLLSIAAV